MSSNRFDFSKDYIFENSVVKLSPLRNEHSNFLSAISNEDDIWTYFLETGRDSEQLKVYVLNAIKNRRLKKEYPFVIFNKRKNKYAGITRLYEYSPELKVIKMGHTWFGKEFWGTGLNKHCKFLLFEFVFEYLKLERIGFGVHGENHRSVNALKSIGCQQEGVLRNFLFSINGETRVDLHLYSLLSSEWKNSVKKMLLGKLD